MKAILVVDTLLFESLTNADVYKYLNNGDFYVVLWTTKIIDTTTTTTAIPHQSHINGLRNGFKPYRYLRMHLKKFKQQMLTLPIIIVDFEKCYLPSSFSYDLCVDFTTIVTNQLYNNRSIQIVDIKNLFTQMYNFLDAYNKESEITNIVSEEVILYNNTVLTLHDILNSPYSEVKTKKASKIPIKIVNKTCVLVVDFTFFSIYHNYECKQFQNFLNSCFLVVWINNTNVNTIQVQNFVKTLKCTYNITIDFILFGLDRGTKSVSLLRKKIPKTTLPLVIIDNSDDVYKKELENKFCDYDYYILLSEYFIQRTFYDMEKIVLKIRKFVHLFECLVEKYQKLKRKNNRPIIEEYDSSNTNSNSSSSDHDSFDLFHRNLALDMMSSSAAASASAKRLKLSKKSNNGCNQY